MQSCPALGNHSMSLGQHTIPPLGNPRDFAFYALSYKGTLPQPPHCSRWTLGLGRRLPGLTSCLRLLDNCLP